MKPHHEFHHYPLPPAASAQGDVPRLTACPTGCVERSNPASNSTAQITTHGRFVMEGVIRSMSSHTAGSKLARVALPRRDQRGPYR